jgi:lipopolysaccharide transport system permease protein
MTTVVRTHEPPLARPREFLRTVWHDLRRSGPLAVEMARRDIRGQYRQTLIGPASVVLTPCAMTAVALGFQQAGILKVDSAAVPYGLFVLVGALLWTTFMDALMAPIYGLLAEQRLLARTNAAPESIVLGKVGQVFFNAGVKVLLLIAALVWHRFAVPPAAIFAIAGVLGLIVIGTAVGLALAPINLLYRDVSRLLSVVTTFWFVFSPVYFPPPASGIVGAIMRLNPVTPALADTRSLLLTGRAVWPAQTAVISLAACVLLAFCWVCVRIVLRVAVEQVNE